MQTATLSVPALWADHHVLKVRDALVPLSGIEDVYASSAWKQVLVRYDESKIGLPAIEQALASAGYPTSADDAPVLTLPTKNRKDPKWADAPMRTTETNQADREMSGEFRRY